MRNPPQPYATPAKDPYDYILDVLIAVSLLMAAWGAIGWILSS